MMNHCVGCNMDSYPTAQEWLRGWREWARTRKRGRMAQFIVEKLEEGVSDDQLLPVAAAAIIVLLL